jgi:hypothetical protein
MIVLVHTIYEGQDPSPVLTHLFYGATQQDALDTLHAHATYDEFLRSALTTFNFKGIPLHSTYQWKTV